MSHNITVITPTGNRPEAFAVCERLMAKQSFKGLMQWLVVDDGTPETKCTMGQKYIRAERLWQPGLNTQRFNLEQALPHIQGDYVFVIEDDDHYRFDYIEQMLKLLQFADIVGEGNSFYYHLQMKGYKEMQNTKHSALSQTAFRKSVVAEFKESIDSGQFYIDLELWRRVLVNRRKALVLSNSGLSTGIKGFAGRENLSGAAQKKDYLYDPYGLRLSARIGADFMLYSKYFKRSDDEKKKGKKIIRQEIPFKITFPQGEQKV